MADAYEQGTGTLRELLRSPFNLFLLANVLASGPRDFATSLPSYSCSTSIGHIVLSGPIAAVSCAKAF